jgi:hypothetical protein
MGVARNRSTHLQAIMDDLVGRSPWATLQDSLKTQRASHQVRMQQVENKEVRHERVARQVDLGMESAAQVREEIKQAAAAAALRHQLIHRDVFEC